MSLLSCLFEMQNRSLLQNLPNYIAKNNEAATNKLKYLVIVLANEV